MTDNNVTQQPEQPTGKFVRVNDDTHARLLRLQGRVQAQSGGRPTLGDAVAWALDQIESQATAEVA